MIYKLKYPLTVVQITVKMAIQMNSQTQKRISRFWSKSG